MIDFDDLDGAEDAGGEEVEAAKEAAARAWEQQRREAELEKEIRRKEAEELHRKTVRELERKRAQQMEERERALMEPVLDAEGNWIPLPGPLPESPWFGCSKHNPQASVRVFCLHGVGVAGGSFVDWVSNERHARWPVVEFVSMELPGHGNHYGAQAIENLGDLAAAFAEKLREWTRGGREPFAIYGFSFGARLAYETVLRLGPAAGGCRKVYVACRGAPHHVARPDTLLASRQEVKQTEGGPSERELLLAMLTGLVDPETLSRYASTFARWERMAEKGDAEFVGRISTFRRALQADCDFCQAPVTFAEDGSIMKFPCPLKLFHSRADEMWPPQKSWPPAERAPQAPYDEWGLDELGGPCYKDLPTSWGLYADDFSSELVPGAHGDLGGPQSAIPESIFRDLTAMARPSQR
mmetsp:Transcript_91745/g.243764  ORF Transcript_91745/g.243764 Transcript_91745/m.243764 type:complete len:411 (-) Transcript_91745:125-1357(-)